MKSQALIVCWFIHLSKCITDGPASSPRALSVHLVIHNTFIYLPTPSDSEYFTWGYAATAPPCILKLPFLHMPLHIRLIQFCLLFFMLACKMKWLQRQLSLGSSKINMSTPQVVRARSCLTVFRLGRWLACISFCYFYLMLPSFPWFCPVMLVMWHTASLKYSGNRRQYRTYFILSPLKVHLGPCNTKKTSCFSSKWL